MVSKLYPIYENHIGIIKEMISKGISRAKVHEELNLPGERNTFNRWCNENNIKTIPSEDIYSQNTLKILELSKEYNVRAIHKILKLPGCFEIFRRWYRVSNIPTLPSGSEIIKPYEKEIIKLILTNTVMETTKIINNKYNLKITVNNLRNYLDRLPVSELIEQYYPGETRILRNVKKIYDWDSIMIEAKIRPFNHISQKYGYVGLHKPCLAEFNMMPTEVFYNKFGYEYHKSGKIEQHIGTIYELLISNPLQYVADRLNIKRYRIAGYIHSHYKGINNFLDYFNRNPTELKFIMNRYDDVTEDMIADSIDE